MQKGIISVIVPIYKSEAFLEECVDSILAQTYSNLEVILVDDGSPDKSGDICDSYAQKDSRVKVIHKANGGASSALNAGLDIAQGEFVAFVGSDDTVDADMYERMYKGVSESRADICVCGYKVIYTDYTRLVRVPCEETLSPKQLWEAHIKSFRKYSTISTIQCNKLVRTALMNKADGEVIRINEGLHNSEDAWFFVDCAELAENGIVFVDFTPYNYLLKNNPSSISKNASYEDINRFIRHLQEIMLRALPDKSAEISKVIECQVNATMLEVSHTAIINKNKPPFKMKWSVIKTILRESTSREEKLSAFMMYFLPRPLYRKAFKLYCKRSVSD
jgi:glycosyltransferase involved in cell wall biosynthesis